ncbi:MAG: N-acetylglucosamine-6-phosphate deacetylase [Candidatus Latescibacteria bacterium]|nr:N-acetylglucosamine-6-phosphate deacetylase [Candidatus Latescibacterota bacterium]
MADSTAAGKRLIFRDADIVTVEGVMNNGVVIVEGNTIKAVKHTHEYTVEDTDYVIECPDYFLCPGLIDLHNQGGGGYSVLDPGMESIGGMARAHAAHGTTGLLLTPPIAEDTYRQLIPELAKTVGADTQGAAILGIHAEGPFISMNKAGCMPHNAIRQPDRAVFDEILESGNGTIKEMTIAPELPGSLNLILELARQGIVVSLGHSNATLTDVLRAIDHGASHVTHFFNAMSPLHHREPGLAGAALYSTDLSVEIIADGFHVHPWIMGLTVQNKGAGLTCLVTDSMHVAGFEDGEYESLGLKVVLKDRRLSLADNPDILAGSVLTMDHAVGNMIRMVGVSLAEAVMMASTTPAAVLGLEHSKGRIETGYDADLVLLDHTYSTVLTVVGGNIVYNDMKD